MSDPFPCVMPAQAGIQEFLMDSRQKHAGMTVRRVGLLRLHLLGSLLEPKMVNITILTSDFQHGIALFARQKRDLVSLSEAAKRLDVNTYAVRHLIHKEPMEAKQIIAYAPFEIESSELEKASARQAIERLQYGYGFRKITPVDDR